MLLSIAHVNEFLLLKERLCSVQIATVASRPDRNSIVLHIGNFWPAELGNLAHYRKDPLYILIMSHCCLKEPLRYTRLVGQLGRVCSITT